MFLSSLFRRTACASPCLKRKALGVMRYSMASAVNEASASSAGDSSSSSTATKATAAEGVEEKKFLEVQDLYLRSLADMENLRNRTKREIEAAHQFAIQKFVKDLVPVADVLEMAITQTTTNKNTNNNSNNIIL